MSTVLFASILGVAAGLLFSIGISATPIVGCVIIACCVVAGFYLGKRLDTHLRRECREL